MQAERARGSIEALPIAKEAVGAVANSADLWNLAGNVRLRTGDAQGAAEWFAKAAELAPQRIDLAVNTAIAWSRARKYDRALDALRPFEKDGAQSAVYSSTRATAERGMGRIHEAADWYDRAIALDPSRVKALHGRARTALERGESDAVARFDTALSANPSDPDLWLGKAQSLNAAGDRQGALAIVEQIAAKAPDQIDNLNFYAQLRRDQGLDDFADCFATAAKASPANPAIPEAHTALLASLDRYAEAAEIACAARVRFGDGQFALLEVINRDAAGQYELAGKLLTSLGTPTGDGLLHAARHAIRIGDPEMARVFLDEAGGQDSFDQQAWSLRVVVWRLCDDPRLNWLLGDGALVRTVGLSYPEASGSSVERLLDRLHDGSPFPLGQSLRGGTQTRGNLFDRTEPALAKLKHTIEAALETYRAGLPLADPTHPLLKHRDDRWHIAGSWSVRLRGGRDHHASHIHPQGILSSALYIRVPPRGAETGEHAGWLELGRPPANLNVDLEPLAVIEPVEGELALFPSFLFHGTRPFAHGDRMSVAFDVAPRQAVPR